MATLHHIQLYSKSNFVTPHIDMLCAGKRRYTTNHIAYKCGCEIINSIAEMCQIENGTQMGFCTVHYLDCLLRTELWKYSVCAFMRHVLYGQQQLSAVALKTTDGPLWGRQYCCLYCNIGGCSLSYYCMFTEEFTQFICSAESIDSDVLLILTFWLDWWLKLTCSQNIMEGVTSISVTILTWKQWWRITK